MRKLLVILVILAGALCYHMTRPETIHEKVNPADSEAVGGFFAQGSSPAAILPGLQKLPDPLQKAYGAWKIRDVAHRRTPQAAWTALSRMSPYMPQALVAIEDRRFYSHHGVDPDAILRATLVNIQADEVVEGASTITQQVVKNLLLSSDQSLKRKVSEAGLALIVEARCSKDEILEMYLNTVFLGSGATGVKQAARVYFHTTPDKLTLSQAAMLAGLPYAPSALNPYENPEGCKKRRNLVLRRMKEQGIITEAMEKEAVAAPLLK